MTLAGGVLPIFALCLEEKGNPSNNGLTFFQKLDMIKIRNKPENSSNKWNLLRLRQMSGQFPDPCFVDSLYTLNKKQYICGNTGSTQPTPMGAWEKQTAGERNISVFMLLDGLQWHLALIPMRCSILAQHLWIQVRRITEQLKGQPTRVLQCNHVAHWLTTFVWRKLPVWRKSVKQGIWEEIVPLKREDAEGLQPIAWDLT